MKITIPIEPMGTVRMTRGMVNRIKWYGGNDPRTNAARKYLAYKEAIAWQARSLYKGDPISGPVELNLTFWLPPPASQSAKKRKAVEGTLHTKKPDRDNLEKGVCDALNKIIWKDDGQVCRGRTEKRYSSNPRIEIEIIEIKEDIGA